MGVINLSLVGPPNQALERMVAAMIARGHLLVAAVGNDGPAAAPLYPASYPGVVGVTAVDRRGQPLPEAARGPQVQFAAPIVAGLLAPGQRRQHDRQQHAGLWHRRRRSARRSKKIFRSDGING